MHVEVRRLYADVTAIARFHQRFQRPADQQRPLHGILRLAGEEHLLNVTCFGNVTTLTICKIEIYTILRNRIKAFIYSASNVRFSAGFLALCGVVQVE